MLGALVSASAFEVVVGGDVAAREFLNVLEDRAREKTSYDALDDAPSDWDASTGWGQPQGTRLELEEPTTGGPTSSPSGAVENTGSVFLERKSAPRSLPRVGLVVVSVLALAAVGFSLVRGDVHDGDWRLVLSATIAVASALLSPFAAMRASRRLANKGTAAPDEPSDKPLSDLEKLAKRTAARHRTSWTIQTSLVVGVSVVLLGVLGWAMALATMNQTRVATFLGGGSVGSGVLARWKWQPFDKMTEARRLADEADVLAVMVGKRIRTIGEIPDPREREKLEWQATLDFIDASRSTAVRLPQGNARQAPAAEPAK